MQVEVPRSAYSIAGVMPVSPVLAEQFVCSHIVSGVKTLSLAAALGKAQWCLQHEQQGVTPDGCAGYAGYRNVDGQSGSHDRPTLAQHPPTQSVQGEGQNPFRSDPAWVSNTGGTLPSPFVPFTLREPAQSTMLLNIHMLACL